MSTGYRIHSWDVSAVEAKRIQEEIREQIDLTDTIALDDIHSVAGVDNAYSGRDLGATAYAVVVAMQFPALEIIEAAYGSAPVTFPYVPGLLTFREAPAILDAFDRLAIKPDVVLFDGQGIAHPRRFGLASHLGVLLDRPSIGVAKSRLTGKYQEPKNEFGAWSPLVDRGEVVGAAVRSKPGHAPLFVSPGNHISLEMAVAVVLACCRGHFLPEPTRLAHNLVTDHRRTAGARE